MKIMVPCDYAGCHNTRSTGITSGMCYSHERQLLRGEKLRPLRSAPKRFDTCLISGCSGVYVGLGMCNKHLLRAKNFNLSVIQLDAILVTPCAICGSTVNIVIDHDHGCCPSLAEGKTCGRCVRGIICTNCNTALGGAKDSVETLRNMIKYLDKGGE